MDADAESGFVRRSDRDPSRMLLEKREVKALLQRIRGNDESTVVLKLKDHIISDINSLVLDEIIVALHENTVCQALYFQNISKAMGDQQLKAMVELIKNKMIWCLNLGENYNISTKTWTWFCGMLPETNVTHMYISEHVIPIELKNRIRAFIRENRKKHDRHSSLDNISVIERCTHCWW
jgi:hypothetical protein